MAGDSRPVGVFDSGVGGLTVAAEIAAAMPAEGLIYFGDTARVPYGAKSKDTVLKYARQITRFLLTQDVKAVVIACNTVSANCYDELRSEFDVPMFEMVGFGAECALTSVNKRVGVIGTEATVRSGAYTRAIAALDPDITTFEKATPLLVPLAEEGWTENTVAGLTCDAYLRELLDKDIDTLILGCTHYPMLAETIKRTAGHGVNVLNPAQTAALAVKRFLRENGMGTESVESVGERRFFVSDLTSKFARPAHSVNGAAGAVAVKVDIDTY